MALQQPIDTLDIKGVFPDGTQLIGGERVPPVKSVIIDGRV